MGVLAPLVDDAIMEEHPDHVPVIFIQHSNDVPQRQFVVHEQVTNSYPAFRFPIQIYGILRNHEPPCLDLETPAKDGLVIHREFFLTRKKASVPKTRPIGRTVASVGPFSS
jgi:hypothetical protein